MMLSSEHFRVLGQKLNGVAEEVCGGKIVYAHEVRKEGRREGGREGGREGPPDGEIERPRLKKALNQQVEKSERYSHIYSPLLRSLPPSFLIRAGIRTCTSLFVGMPLLKK
jgi:hypothetical protein